MQGVNIIMEPIRRERQVKRSADATRAEQVAPAPPLQQAWTNKSSTYPVGAPVARIPFTRALSTQNPIKKGGTRKRHVMRQ